MIADFPKCSHMIDFCNCHRLTTTPRATLSCDTILILYVSQVCVMRASHNCGMRYSPDVICTPRAWDTHTTMPNCLTSTAPHAACLMHAAPRAPLPAAPVMRAFHDGATREGESPPCDTAAALTHLTITNAARITCMSFSVRLVHHL